MNCRIRTLIVILGLMVVPGLLFAQTATVTGTVTDMAGAVVAKATVTARNVDTSLTRSVPSSGAGVYSISNLPVGTYEVNVQSSGFSALKTRITLTVGQVATLNLKLEVGKVSTVVDVSGEAATPVQLEDAQVSNLVESKQIQTLPMVTRDPYSLVLMSPGTMQSNSRLGGVSVNGSRERNNNFTLDGTDNNDTSVPGGASGLSSLNPEATQEFRVITNNFMPEYGRNTGAIIDVVTKSGTNAFHGEGHWFGRYNSVGGARDFFNTTTHGADPASDNPQDPYVRNIFGYSLGGPVQKNKTFFFFANEFQRFRTATTSVVNVPTDNFKSGKFSYLDDSDPANVITRNVDLTNPQDPNNPYHLTVDPTIAKILAIYPSPNGPGGNDLFGRYYFPTKSAWNSYNLTGKIDHQFTDNQRVSLRYNYGRGDDPDPSHDDELPGIGSETLKQRTHSLSGTWTSILRSNLVNEFKASANRADAGFYCNGLDQINSLTGGRDFNFPTIAKIACFNLGDSDAQARRTGTYSLADTLSWTKGSHSMKFGSEFRFVFEDGYTAFSSREYLDFGVYSSSRRLALAVTDPKNPSATDQDLAWMLGGIVGTQSQSQFFDKNGARTAVDNRKFRQREYGIFAQDSWKIRPNLTLNYGLRWAFNGVPYEANNNLSNLLGDPTAAGDKTFSLVGPGTGTLLYNNSLGMFEPRVGFAWDPFGKGTTSIRGGFGMFHDRVFGNLFGNARGNAPFQQDYQQPYSKSVQSLQTLPSIPTLPTSTTIPDGMGAWPLVFSRDMKMPLSKNWNFGIEQQLAGNFALELNYIGSRGSNLLTMSDANPGNPTLVQQLLAAGVDPSELQGQNIWFGTNPAVYNSAIYHGSLVRSIGESSYDSLQANLSKNFSHGLRAQAAYTWSHAIDNSMDPIDAGAGSANGYSRYPWNIDMDRGNSDSDMRHRVSINYSYDLPFGRGKNILANGLVGKALEGWQLSGITSWQTGHPYSIYSSRDTMHVGRNGYAALVGDPFDVHSDAINFTGLNKAAFSRTPDWGTFPRMRNQFYGPHYSVWNAVLSKTLKINERVNVGLRFEGYNLFNHTNFDLPVATLTSPDFGSSFSEIGNPDGTTGARQLQFGAKISF